MSKPPVMACAECGAEIAEGVYQCPLCASRKVEWTDLAAGLEWHIGRYVSSRGLTPVKEGSLVAEVMHTAANLIRAQQEEIEELKAQGGAKRRRQEASPGPTLWLGDAVGLWLTASRTVEGRTYFTALRSDGSWVCSCPATKECHHIRECQNRHGLARRLPRDETSLLG